MQVKFTDNNNKEFTISLEEAEVQYFVEYAMMDLLRKGIISIENTEDQTQLEFLENIDSKNMPSA